MSELGIQVGSVVVALRNGGCDRHGLPSQRPVAGKHYRVTSIYEMPYGLGCTLQGMDPSPYQGYFLHVQRARGKVAKGWYFEPIEVAGTEWSQALYDMIRSKNHDT